VEQIGTLRQMINGTVNSFTTHNIFELASSLYLTPGYSSMPLWPGQASLVGESAVLNRSEVQKHAGRITSRGGFIAFFDLPGRDIVERNATSVSQGNRNAIMHIVGANAMLLSDSSYFGESSYEFPAGVSWQQRYWGDNYPRLLEIKRKYDPEGIFWCHNCVGSDVDRSAARGRDFVLAVPGFVVLLIASWFSHQS